MFNLFALIPLAVCIYEIISLILPLKFPAWAKILCALILLSGIAKNFLLRRTTSGFDIYELNYFLTLYVSVIFNFIIFTLFVLLVKDICWLAWKIFIRSPFPAHYASVFVLVLAIVATIYGTYQGLKLPDVNTHDVKISGLPKELDGMKIAMLVDIHADTLTNRSAVQKIVDRTNALHPDVILIPGDFVDGTVKNRFADLEPLKNLKATRGIFGTTGNHEYYYDFSGWMKTLPELGIKLLSNESVTISSGDAKITIAGLPDNTSEMMNIAPRDLNAALKNVPENSPVILMDHQPRNVRENARHKIALQVSGHTHGGQMPVMYTLVKRANGGFVRGWYDVDGTKLYVSPGTSQWNGFAFRLFDPSEITLFVLRFAL